MINIIKNNKEFYKTLFFISLPIILQNFITSSLSMVDTILVGRLGESQIAAVGQANQIMFLMTLLLFGVGSGTAIFTAQFWGNKNYDGFKKSLGIGVTFAIVVSGIFTVCSLVIPELLISIYSKDQEVIRYGASFLKIVCFSYTFSALTLVLSFVLRTTGNVKLPMVASIIGFITNTLLNFIFIFGFIGIIPAMGVRGSACATVIARIIELSIIVIFTYKLRLPSAVRIKEMFSYNFSYVKGYLKIALPVIANEGLWALGTTTYSVVYGRMGTDITSAMVIALAIDNMAFILVRGIGSASGIIVGNEIGSGDTKKAYKCGVLFAITSIFIGIVTGAIVIPLAWPILGYVNVSNQIRMMSFHVIIVMAVLLTVKSFNFTLITGVFRAGGDTIFCLMADLLGVWCLGVPAAFIFGVIFKWPIHWVFFMINIEEICKIFICILRLRSRKWINNVNL